jgi:galactokinase
MTDSTLTQSFAQHFGHSPEHVVHSPGRVNLIGEHTDYNGGFVFPAAINFGTTIAVSKRLDKQVSVLALDYDQQVNTFSVEQIEQDPDQGWANYVRGVVIMLKQSYPELSGVNMAVTGDVPQGAGLSSSASFEVAIIKAFATCYDLPISGVQAALLGQKAENEFVGCACGIMDQLISALGKKDHAMLLDCQQLTYKHTHLPDGFNIMIIDSNVKRGLVDSEYNTRRAQCEEAASVMELDSLRAATMEQLIASKDQMSPDAFKRAHHVLTENERTLAMFDALQQEDIVTVSRTMSESHASMRDDFEITVPPIDTLVEIVASVIGEKGGVRMTGGGFGGCVGALVPDELVEETTQAINQQYQSKTGYIADIYICTAEQGAFS